MPTLCFLKQAFRNHDLNPTGFPLAGDFAMAAAGQIARRDAAEASRIAGAGGESGRRREALGVEHPLDTLDVIPRVFLSQKMRVRLTSWGTRPAAVAASLRDRLVSRFPFGDTGVVHERH